MRILYDQHMPFARDFLEGLGDIHGFEQGQLSPSLLKDCDVLLVRSTTKITAELLAHAPKLSFVGTATAGYDHFDTKALEARGIYWTNAAGCNARAVAEYVICAILTMARRYQLDLSQKSIAIVGVGQIGSRLATRAQALGLNTILYDPPRAASDQSFSSAQFDQVLAADIISLHVPLIDGGPFPTRNLIGQTQLQALSESQILINACRGEVIDNAYLLNSPQHPLLVLDCWANEPDIDCQLFEKCEIATAHTAGHSLEGKARGTALLYQALTRFLARQKDKQLSEFLPAFDTSQALQHSVDAINRSSFSQEHIHDLCKCFYDIENDDSFFRAHMAKSGTFAEFRRNYPIRREFDAKTLDINNKKAEQVLKQLGFKLASDSNDK